MKPDCTITLHIESTRPDKSGDYPCPAFSIPGVQTWQVTRTDDVLVATKDTDHDWYRPRQFQLRHDGKIGATFRTLALARSAGVVVAALWDNPGLPEMLGDSIALRVALRDQPGRC
jgi:hypothetical protein